MVAKRFSYASLKGSGLGLILDFLPAKVLGLPMIRVGQPVGLTPNQSAGESKKSYSRARLVLHQAADEVDITAEPIELGDDDGHLGLARPPMRQPVAGGADHHPCRSGPR